MRIKALFAEQSERELLTQQQCYHIQMMQRDKIIHTVFASVIFACVIVIGAAIYTSFNTDCKRSGLITLCGG